MTIGHATKLVKVTVARLSMLTRVRCLTSDFQRPGLVHMKISVLSGITFGITTGLRLQLQRFHPMFVQVSNANLLNIIV